MLLLDHGFLSLWLEMNHFSGTNSTADESKIIIYKSTFLFVFFAMHNPFSSSAKSKSPNYRGSNFMFWGQNAIFCPFRWKLWNCTFCVLGQKYWFIVFNNDFIFSQLCWVRELCQKSEIHSIYCEVAFLII